MELNFRKLWTVLGVACLSANLAAAPASSSNTSTQKTGKDDHSMMASGLMYSGPMLSEDATGISLGADYILWQVVQEGLETVSNNYYPTGTTTPTMGSTVFPSSSLLSGFKVHGAVTIAECDNIDLFVQYIWLQRSTKTNTGTGGSTTLPAFIVNVNDLSDIDQEPVVTYSSGFRIAYNVLDFEMGRWSSIAKDSFAIRPFFGIRGTWNTSTWTPTYTGSLDFTTPTLNTVNNVNSYQNTSGAGVRAGMDLAWKFFNNSDYFGGLKVLGMSALSGVYGRTYVNTACYTTPSSQGSTAGTFYWNQSSLNRLVPVIDLSIGLGWDMSFGGEADDDYNVEIHALWETQSWINYGKHLTAYLIPRGAQNLGIQGLTVGASVEF
ncbi:MAG: Lpg1974 family pore-forming outer membrane protein [Chlamydiia bacterium]